MRPDAATRTAPVRLAAMTLPIAGVLLMSVQPSAAQDARNANADAGNACAADNGGITLSPGLLRHRLRRQHRPCPPSGCGAERRSLRQHLERPLLRRTTPAAGGRFPGRAQDTKGPARPTSSSALARTVKQARPAAPASRSTTARSMRRSTTGSSATRCAGRICQQARPEVIVVRNAAGRRPPDASIRDRRRGQPVSSTWARPPTRANQEPHGEVAGHQALHGTGDARRHLALRRQQGPARVLARRALCHRHPQRRGHAFDAAGQVFVTQHGRDQLAENWSKLYKPGAGRRTCRRKNWLQLEQGGDYGWPECYFDPFQKSWSWRRNMAATVGRQRPCARRSERRSPPFPATGRLTTCYLFGQQFPARLSQGRVHRLPRLLEPRAGAQGGYNVVFQPLADGKASGD